MGICGCRGSVGQDHVNAVIDETISLLNQGYHVYLEQSFAIGSSWNAVVDIYAKKGKKELMIEVGSLATSFTTRRNRLKLLKEVRPNCKIIWVRQWSPYEVQLLK